MKRPVRRAVCGLAAVIAVPTLTACGAEPPFQDLPGGGVDARSSTITVDDMWVSGPHGVVAGATAPLRLTLSNESPSAADTLVAVSTPVARSTRLLQGGHVVSGIAIPPGGFVDLESTAGVELEGLREPIPPGQWFPVTLTFARSAPITQLVTVGPLAAPEPRYPAATIAG